MTDATDHAILNAARAVQALANDIHHSGGSGSIGARIYATLGAITSAAGSIASLAEDLRAALSRLGSKS